MKSKHLNKKWLWQAKCIAQWNGYKAVKQHPQYTGYLFLCPDRRKWEWVPVGLVKRLWKHRKV